MKTCTKCKETKSSGQFFRRLKSKDELSHWCKICVRIYQERNRPKIKRYRKQYELEHKEESRQYYINNKVWIEKRKKDYYLTHKAEIYKQKKLYYMDNKIRINLYCKNKRILDINYKMTCNLRKRLSTAIRRGQKLGSAVRDLGCLMNYFKVYIESKFKDGMNWDNYGRNGWHIDHIKPLASFDLNDRQQFLEACHYTNLQPLWAYDNLSKGSKILST